MDRGTMMDRPTPAEGIFGEQLMGAAERDPPVRGRTGGTLMF